MKSRPERSFVMTVLDGEGVSHRYFVKARSLGAARRHADEWVRQTEWSASLADVSPVDATSRRLFAVAATTFVVSSLVISAAMVVGLSLEGAL